MKDISINEIMISDKVESANTVLFKIKFLNKIIVDDFELRETSLEVLVKEDSNGKISLIDDFSKEEEKYILNLLDSVNDSKYEVYYFDAEKNNFFKDIIKGLKNILNLNNLNNIISITLVE